MRNKAGLLMMALVVILSAGCGNKEKENEKEPESEIQQAEEQQVSFTGVDINGDQLSSDIFADSKITMVNVWATYCNPCLSEMPGLGELAESYDTEEFQVIGIISDVLETADQKTIDLARELITQTKAQYPHLLLNESVYYALLTDVSVVPTTFFVDENGVVLDTVLGAMDKSAWEKKIDELLGKE